MRMQSEGIRGVLTSGLVYTRSEEEVRDLTRKFEGTKSHVRLRPPNTNVTIERIVWYAHPSSRAPALSVCRQVPHKIGTAEVKLI